MLYVCMSCMYVVMLYIHVCHVCMYAYIHTYMTCTCHVCTMTTCIRRRVIIYLFVHVRSTFFYLCIHLAVVVPFQLKRYKRLKVYAFGAPYMMLCTFMYAF